MTDAKGKEEYCTTCVAELEKIRLPSVKAHEELIAANAEEARLKKEVLEAEQLSLATRYEITSSQTKMTHQKLEMQLVHLSGLNGASPEQVAFLKQMFLLSNRCIHQRKRT